LKKGKVKAEQAGEALYSMRRNRDGKESGKKKAARAEKGKGVEFATGRNE